MKTKTISTRQWATIKRIAQSVQPMVSKKEALQKKIKDLAEEYQSLEAQIDGFEQGIKALCEGLSSEQLVIRTVSVVPDRFDKDGKPLKKVSYEPTSLVQYNEQANNYTIILPEEEAPSAETEPVGTKTEETAE